MLSFLNSIRSPENKITVRRKIAVTALITCFGIILGVVSKFLDCTPSNELPQFIEQLDFRNFLGRFAVWIFIAVCISIYSKSANRAAINVFAFFVGMVTSYYLYSEIIAGFFPRSYALIWGGFTFLSPVLAFICWYAKGKGKIAIIISAGIIAVLFNTTFAYGSGYFDIKSPLELSVFILAIIVLHRTIKETFIVFVLGVVLAIFLNIFIPFQFW